jgi:glycosyltransferase involved in cell wall biosynthesis
MKITFILPAPSFTGGARVAFDYADLLRAAGHDTTVLFPMIPYRFRDSARRFAGVRSWLGGLRNNVLHGTKPPRQPTLREIRMVPRINNRFVPDADAIVATAWPTARSIARLSPGKGAKCYIVQHREIDSGLRRDVDATYRLPLFRIAGSEYTARLLREEVGVEVDAVVRNGIDVSFWSECPVPRPARSGVLMPHAPGERKGAVDGFAAFERVRREIPAARLRCFGRRRAAEIPDFVDYVENPDDATLRTLYAEAAVLLFPSRYEGYGLPPLEAMAGGCPVVSTKVGAVPEIIEDGVNGILVAPRDVEGMAAAMLRLLGHADLRARMGVAGRARARGFDVSVAARQFEQALRHAVERRGRG